MMTAITVKFDANGGYCDVKNKRVFPGEDYGMLPIPQREGYIFTGWWPEKDLDSEVYVSSKTVSVTYNHVLYAHWAKPYKIINEASHKCLNINGNNLTSLVNGKNVTVWEDSGNDEQLWLISDFSERRCIHSFVDKDYALNVHRIGSPYNCNVYRLFNNEKDSTLCFIGADAGGYQIKLYYYDLYLTVQGDSDGSNVCWKKKDDSAFQIWYFEECVEESIPHDGFSYPTDERLLSQGYSSTHSGIDIPAITGSPVYAFADGVVAYVQYSDEGWSPYDFPPPFREDSMESMGNCIAINHFNPNQELCEGEFARTVYMHLNNAPALKIGDKVTAGEIIGYVGNTGRSTGPHLHFSLCVGNDVRLSPDELGWIRMYTLPTIDPRKYLTEYQK